MVVSADLLCAVAHFTKRATAQTEARVNIRVTGSGMSIDEDDIERASMARRSVKSDLPNRETSIQLCLVNALADINGISGRQSAVAAGQLCLCAGDGVFACNPRATHKQGGQEEERCLCDVRVQGLTRTR